MSEGRWELEDYNVHFERRTYGNNMIFFKDDMGMVVDIHSEDPKSGHYFEITNPNMFNLIPVMGWKYHYISFSSEAIRDLFKRYEEYLSFSKYITNNLCPRLIVDTEEQFMEVLEEVLTNLPRNCLASLFLNRRTAADKRLEKYVIPEILSHRIVGDASEVILNKPWFRISTKASVDFLVENFPQYVVTPRGDSTDITFYAKNLGKISKEEWKYKINLLKVFGSVEVQLNYNTDYKLGYIENCMKRMHSILKS